MCNGRVRTTKTTKNTRAYVDSVLLETKLEVLHELVLADSLEEDKVSHSGLGQIHSSTVVSGSSTKKRQMRKKEQAKNKNNKSPHDFPWTACAREHATRSTPASQIECVCVVVVGRLYKVEAHEFPLCRDERDSLTKSGRGGKP